MRSSILPNVFQIGFGNTTTSSTSYAALLWHTDGTSSFSAVADERDSAGTEQYIFSPYGGVNTTTAPVNVWWFGAVTYPSLSSRFASIWQAGVISKYPALSNTGAVIASPFTHVMVSSVQPAIGDLGSTGTYLAECCYWDAELGYADIAALAQGASPLSIGPRNSLIDYWPLRGDLKNWGTSEVGLQEIGTAPYPRTWGEHPPVMPPPRGKQFFVGPGAAKRKPQTFVAS